MERQGRSKLNLQICEEACEWFVESRSGDLDDAARRELDRWLRKSPEHLAAYLEIAAIWCEAPGLEADDRSDVESLQVQAAATRDSVVVIHPAAAGGQLRVSDATSLRGRAGDHASRRKWLPIAASVAAVSIAVGAALWSSTFRDTYATAVGEQRSIVLADGSMIELNSRSRVKVRYSVGERAVELLEGQALFKVAKDRNRPFNVRSAGTQVQAVGTEFDVYKKRSGTVVTVVEGRVAVSQAGSSVNLMQPADATGNSAPSKNDAAVLLSAGEQLTVTAEAIRKSPQPSIDNAIAWRQRQLVFESLSLAGVAEEFNRYNRRQLIIEDPELFDFHISGVFSSTDPAALVRFLRQRADVRVEETSDEIRVAKKNVSGEVSHP